MRLLFLSNFYPPASRGGYEQWCQEVLEALRAHGHEVCVLTSDFGAAKLDTPDPAWVQRTLHLEMELASLKNAFQFFTHRKRREQNNLAGLRALVASFRPEAILVWGMWNLPRSLPALAEELLPGRVVYYMGDYWPTLPDQFENYWNAAPRNLLTGLPKLLLRPLALRTLSQEARPMLKFAHVLFPSAFMKREFVQKGLTPPKASIVAGAIDTRPYLADSKVSNDQLSLLYIGRLTQEKGVHTAILAVAELVHRIGLADLHLNIVGDGEPDYVAHLRDLITQHSLASYVDLKPAQPKETMPALYRSADIFLFTSIWPEPFGRVIVEAMASGVTVIGTPVGGAAEILVENVNALTFPPDDAASLARQIQALRNDPALRLRLARAGREWAVSRFDLQAMTSGIENYLQAVVNS